LKKKSYAKVNIFLKIAGKNGNYHNLVSRFARVKNHYDIIKFKKCRCDKFTLEGNFGCHTKQNTIFKAYKKLTKISKKVKKYFKTHKVIVKKNIQEFAGLGGGSSNCATFILMVNDVCNLKLSKKNMAKIGASIGADVPFFIYEFDSANVTNIGNKVKKFNEDILDIEVFTPKLKCDTKEIFKIFREKFYKKIKKQKAKKMLKIKSIDILKKLNIKKANDLYLPALQTQPKLKKYIKKGWYFSGSGSSFFRIKQKNDIIQNQNIKRR
jgi:4-diphosphocytidyl-2-C-methyl-D-erythritol kinase